MTPAQQQETRILFESLHEHIYSIRIEAKVVDRTKILILLPEYYTINYREYIHALRQSSAMVFTPEFFNDYAYRVTFTEQIPDNDVVVFADRKIIVHYDNASKFIFRLGGTVEEKAATAGKIAMQRITANVEGKVKTALDDSNIQGIAVAARYNAEANMIWFKFHYDWSVYYIDNGMRDMAWYHHRLAQHYLGMKK